MSTALLAPTSWDKDADKRAIPTIPGQRKGPKPGPQRPAPKGISCRAASNGRR